MAAKFIAATLLMMACAWLFGCASSSPQRKANTPQPKVLEEDIAEKQSASPSMEGQTSGPAVSGPTPPVEGYSPPVDPNARRSKGRYIWRDRPGSEKGWEVAPDRSGDQ